MKPLKGFWTDLKDQIKTEWQAETKDVGKQFAEGLKTLTTAPAKTETAPANKTETNAQLPATTTPVKPPAEEPPKKTWKDYMTYYIIGGVVLIVMVVWVVIMAGKKQKPLNGYKRKPKRKPKVKRVLRGSIRQKKR